MTSKAERIIAFDVLRVIMLFLLIVFHAGVSFMVTDIDDWYYTDDSTNIVFDGVLAFIHAFRHPLFFIISGYVTELMYSRYSEIEVLKKRLGRIGIPLLIVMLTLAPIVVAVFILINNGSENFTLESVFQSPTDGSFTLITGYVWFLYYLLIFNVFHLVLRKWMFAKLFAGLPILYRQIVAFVIITVCLVGFKLESLYGDYRLLPNFASLFGYYMFYILGYSMVFKTKDFDFIKKNSNIYLAIGSIAFGAYLWIKYIELQSGQNSYLTPATISYSIAVFGYVFGGLGLTMKLYKKQNKIINYFSKASYFLYLIHLPIMMYFLYILAPISMNPFVKFLLIISPTMIISIFSLALEASLEGNSTHLANS